MRVELDTMKRPLNVARLCSVLMLVLVLPLTSGGCVVFGYVAYVMPKPPVKAAYAGLAGQRVVVMTWADRPSTYDYPTLPSDVTMLVETKLKQAASPEAQKEELKGTAFVDARQVIRWQKNHPELEMRSVAELAPKAAAALGCTRLIYIEVQPFYIHDPRTPVLLKGYASATVHVAEVHDGVAKVVYEETGIEETFPTSSPEGVPPTDAVTPAYIYKGLLNRLTTQIAVRFFTTSEDEQPK